MERGSIAHYGGGYAKTLLLAGLQPSRLVNFVGHSSQMTDSSVYERTSGELHSGILERCT